MSESKKTREIDLFDLFASIGRGIKNLFVGLFDALMWCLFFAIKKYKILLVFFVVGLGFGIFKVTTSKDLFSSTMLIRSNAISSFELKEKVDDFNNYFIQSNEYSDKKLRQELQMDSFELSQISGIESFFGIDLNVDEESTEYSIEFFDVSENHDLSDTINVRDKKYLLIKANIFDPSVLPQFQKNFIDYLNRQPMLMKENEQRLESLSKEISGYDIELTYLDSLQKTSYFTGNQPSLKFERNQIMLGETRKFLVHYYKFEISGYKDEIISEYTVFSDPVTVINDFSLAVKQESSSVIQVIKFIIIFTFLGYLILLVRYYLMKVSDKYLSKIDD